MVEKKVGRLTLEKKRAIIEREDSAALSVRQQCGIIIIKHL